MRRRERQRLDLIEQFGGRCADCAYDRCRRALHFHHVAGEREGKAGHADLNEVSAYPDRFRLLCANCHIETHDRLNREAGFYAVCARCKAAFRTSPHRPKNRRARYCSRNCQHDLRGETASSPARVLERMLKYVRVEGPRDCWIWIGACNGTTPILMITDASGKHSPRSVRQISLELHGVVPPRRTAPWCGSKRCVRPEHLVPAQMVGAV